METLEKLAIVLVFVIIAYFVITFLKKGISLGKSGGDGEGVEIGGMPEVSISDSITEEDNTVTTIEAEPTITEIKYVDVTIKENKYVYIEKEFELDELIEQLKNLSDGEHVRIYDDGGLQEALDNLISKLNENNIEYLDETNPNNT